MWDFLVEQADDQLSANRFPCPSVGQIFGADRTSPSSQQLLRPLAEVRTIWVPMFGGTLKQPSRLDEGLWRHCVARAIASAILVSSNLRCTSTVPPSGAQTPVTSIWAAGVTVSDWPDAPANARSRPGADASGATDGPPVAGGRTALLLSTSWACNARAFFGTIFLSVRKSGDSQVKWTLAGWVLTATAPILGPVYSIDAASTVAVQWAWIPASWESCMVWSGPSMRA